MLMYPFLYRVCQEIKGNEERRWVILLLQSSYFNIVITLKYVFSLHYVTAFYLMCHFKTLVGESADVYRGSLSQWP